MRASSLVSRLAVLAIAVLGATATVACAEGGVGSVAQIPDAVGVSPAVREQVIADLAAGTSAVESEANPVALAPLPAANTSAAPSAEEVIFDAVTGFPSFPLPSGDPPPLGPGVFNSGFRDPLPRSPVWNPPGAKRVGLQAGHWETNNVPFELRRLSPGSTAGGWTEAELNMLLARHAARYLEEAGIEVDILPTTIPVRYRAHAFVSIHADGDTSGRLNGYKIARPAISSIPEADDEFVRIMYEEYGAATGLPRDSDNHISRRMTYYYAFNTRRYQHAIDLGTPAQIIETGFLTNASDRAFLTSRPDLAGRGIANGILRFLALELGRTDTWPPS